MRRAINTEKTFKDYYQIYFDEFPNLEFVRFNTLGLAKLAGIYNTSEKYSKYKINIAVTQCNYSLENLQARLEEESESLQNGEIKGLIIGQVNFNGSGLYHTYPFMIAKINQTILVLDFEQALPAKLDFEGLVKKVEGYTNLQADYNSCGIFSITSLKNAFKDEKLMTQISEFKIKENFQLQYSITGQDFESIEKLDESKSKKYVRRINFGPELNLKAFYKGHDLARRINPDHLKFLAPDTLEIISQIDKDRMAMKASHDSQEKNYGFKPMAANSLVQKERGSNSSNF